MAEVAPNAVSDPSTKSPYQEGPHPPNLIISADDVRFPSLVTLLHDSTALPRPLLAYPHHSLAVSSSSSSSCQLSEDLAFPHAAAHESDSPVSHHMLEDLPCSHANDDHKGATCSIGTAAPARHGASPHAKDSDDAELGSDDVLCPPSFSECSSTVSLLSNAASQSNLEPKETEIDVAPVEARWTDAKHRSYLSFMEANFIRDLYSRKYCVVDVCGEAPCHTECDCAAFPAEIWNYGGGRGQTSSLTWSAPRNPCTNDTVNHSHSQANNARSLPLADIFEEEEVDSPMTGTSLEAPAKAGETLVHEAIEKEANHIKRGVASSKKRGSCALNEGRAVARQKANRQ